MIVVTVTHDKACRILTNDTIGIKTVIMVFTMMSVMSFSIMAMFFMLRFLTSMVTVLLVMMVLLSRFFYWFAWFLQWCWLQTVTRQRNHSRNLFFQCREFCIWNEMIVISVRNRYTTWCPA